MKNNVVLAITVLFCASLCFSAALYAEDVNAAAKNLSSEIRQEAGLTDSEQKLIHSSVKEMLGQGADKDDIRNAVSGMAKKGIRGEDLKVSVESMKDLVKGGKSPKDAGNIISQAAHQAKAEGLKGKDLASRVHEAVKEMQAENKQKHERNSRNESKPLGGGQRESHGLYYFQCWPKPFEF